MSTPELVQHACPLASAEMAKVLCTLFVKAGVAPSICSEASLVSSISR